MFYNFIFNQKYTLNLFKYFNTHKNNKHIKMKEIDYYVCKQFYYNTVRRTKIYQTLIKTELNIT